MSQLLVLEEDASSSGDSPFVEVLDGKSAQNESLEVTKEQFEQTYQQYPQFVARAPGRVNLIGEHIDYNGFGVLPMALEQSAFVACRSSTKASSEEVVTLDLKSTNPGAEPRHYVYNLDQVLASFTTQEDDTPPFDATTERDWSHYVLCAFFGVLEQLSKEDPDWTPRKIAGQTYSLLIHGTVPQGAGVSSSSALVVSSALAFLALFRQVQRVTKSQLAKLCARCERWIGTEGGGMDQAISVFGSTQFIQFQPTFQLQAISLPSSISWVVCHSLEESHKRHDAATQFNKRVVECKIGGRWLAQALGLVQLPPTLLWDLVRESNKSFQELEAIVQEQVPETCTTKEVGKLVGSVGVETAQLKQLASELGITRPAGVEVLKVANSWCLRDRLLHVLSETRRVQEFTALCGSGEDETRALGELMNQSHQSCSQLYECSSSQVDRLQQVCLDAGALGSRMTGAGWGGCVISMVDKSCVEGFCQHMREKYYAALPSHITSNKNETDYMFVTTPSPGSNLFDFGAD